MSPDQAEFYLLKVAPAISLFWVLVAVIFKLLARCEKWKDTETLPDDEGDE